MMRITATAAAQSLFRAIAPPNGDGTATLGLRSLRWGPPTAFLAASVLAAFGFAGSAS